MPAQSITKMATKTHTKVILFTRFPRPGQAKTRLIPTIGKHAAAELQKYMTEFTVAQVRQTGFPLQVRFTDGTFSQMRNWLGHGTIDYAPQGDGNLGQRIARAFDDAFAAGDDKVLVVGCDCPDNRAPNLCAAAEALDRAPCVIGPAADGGYYLIGLSSPFPDLFQNIDWGSSSVFQQTRAKLKNSFLLPRLQDVDEPEDIPCKISVVIPVRNEAARIERLVSQAREAFNTEVIVVDGGSFDQTCERAARAGANVIASSPGRACQMNRGAQVATGKILLFLHADSRLPAAWDHHVRMTLQRPRTVMGFFRFSLSEAFAGRHIIEWGTHLRSRLLQRPYGDQGLFLSHDTFLRIGGFPDVPILEDVLFVKRARQLGRLACTKPPLMTSGRRWLQYGLLKTTVLNQAVLMAAALGADLNALSRAYHTGTNPFRALTNKYKDATS